MNSFLQLFSVYPELLASSGFVAFVVGLAWAWRVRSQGTLKLEVLNGENQALVQCIESIQSENATLEFSLADTAVEPEEQEEDLERYGSPENQNMILLSRRLADLGRELVDFQALLANSPMLDLHDYSAGDAALGAAFGRFKECAGADTQCAAMIEHADQVKDVVASRDALRAQISVDTAGLDKMANDQLQQIDAMLSKLASEDCGTDEWQEAAMADVAHLDQMIEDGEAAMNLMKSRLSDTGIRYAEGLQDFAGLIVKIHDLEGFSVEPDAIQSLDGMKRAAVDAWRAYGRSKAGLVESDLFVRNLHEQFDLIDRAWIDARNAIREMTGEDDSAEYEARSEWGGLQLKDLPDAPAETSGTPDDRKKGMLPAKRGNQTLGEDLFEHVFDRRCVTMDEFIGPRYITEITAGDELREIAGIDDRAMMTLNDLGIYDFSQISFWNAEQVKELQGMFGDEVDIVGDRWQYQALRLFESTSGVSQYSRAIARHRIRRLLYKNDSAEMPTRPTTPASFLEERMDRIRRLPVDTLFYTTTAWDRAAQPSSVCEPMGVNGDRERKGWTEDLRSCGVDLLKMVNEWAHGESRECFFSLPMNPPCMTSPSGLGSSWKERHPECLIGERDEKFPETNRWDAVDYRHPAVRQHLYAVIEEIAQKYSVDGIDLDFLSDPILFRETALGGSVSREVGDHLTALLDQIHTLSTNVSEQRRHSLLVSVRVPGTMSSCHDLGIWIEDWIERGLIDLLVIDSAGGVDESLINLAVSHQIPVFSCVGPETSMAEVEQVAASLNEHPISAMVLAEGVEELPEFLEALVRDIET